MLPEHMHLKEAHDIGGWLGEGGWGPGWGLAVWPRWVGGHFCCRGHVCCLAKEVHLNRWGVGAGGWVLGAGMHGCQLGLASSACALPSHEHTHTHLAPWRGAGESLQAKIEMLPEIARAYVHLDYETTHAPEH